MSSPLRKYTNIVGRHDDYVSSVAFSPDGKKIVSGGWDSTVRLWDLDGKSKIIGRHDDYVWSIAFSPDGKKIVFGGDNTVRLWDLSRSDGNELVDETGKIVGRHDGSVFSVAFSPDGKKIVSGGGDRTIRLWDLIDEIGKIIGRHDDFVESVAFSPDNKKIASGGKDCTVRLWDLTRSARAERDRGNKLGGTGKIIGRHDNPVNSIAFSPDGKKIVSGGYDKTVLLWVNPYHIRDQKKTLV